MRTVAYIIAASGWCVAAIVVGASLSKTWLEHWQTLVTGLAAVCAAVGTIWATRHAAKLQADATEKAADRQVALARRQLRTAVAELRYTKNRDRGLRDTQDRETRRRQAELVTGWLTGERQKLPGSKPSMGLAFHNASDQVVYDVIASLVSLQGAFRETAVGDQREDAHDLRALIGNVPPGKTSAEVGFYGFGMNIRRLCT